MVTNREVFAKDPVTATIPNEGVAKIASPQDERELAKLRYELETFVCEGEYARGLDRILSSYLGHLDQAEQPGVWVSGFFGSGKSHLVKVLQYLWRDFTFPDGATARGLARLPADIQAQIHELTTRGRRGGGLWAAAGELGGGDGPSVRLAMLAIVFEAAGLPQQYPAARFALYLHREGIHDQVKAQVETRGRKWFSELRNMYVSTPLVESLLAVDPSFAADVPAAKAALRAQFPPLAQGASAPAGISLEDFTHTLQEVLLLRSERPNTLPCTLIVLDELQQFIGQDDDRARQVQEVVQACEARFHSRVLVVATGQASLQGTPQLQKLQDRFPVQVMLSDTDVEVVVRQVVLQKRQDRVPFLRQTLDGVLGEIDRHLGGTRIAATPADHDVLVPDYPLLPTRRRFWEWLLRSVDHAGRAGQLRTQLKIVHEAVRRVAERSLGHVVPGDFVYDQLESSMLQSGVLLREIAELIRNENDGTVDGRLRSRLCALVFLVGKLDTEGPLAAGVRATPEALADLLIEDLPAGSVGLRQQVPALLDELTARGVLLKVGDEYRLQTRESAEWQQDFNRRYTRIHADDMAIPQERTRVLREAVERALKGVGTLQQGVSKVGRGFATQYGGGQPKPDGERIPVWVRDGWATSESSVRDDAIAAGDQDPTVFVFLPRLKPQAVHDTLAAYLTARECITHRPTPSTPEGVEAHAAMQSRVNREQAVLNDLIKDILAGARVYQAGGHEVAEAGLVESVREAIKRALDRQFPRFAMADHPNWNTVVIRARQGAGDALAEVGYHGDVESHPVCQEVRLWVGAAGKRGAEVRKHFEAAPYGWSRDAVDGALLALLAAGHLRATRNGVPVKLAQVEQSSINSTEFRAEGQAPSMKQRLAFQSLAQVCGLAVKANEEADAAPRLLDRLADAAAAVGGLPPLPATPPLTTIEELRGLGGNEQVIAIAEREAELRADYQRWQDLRKKADARLPVWQELESLAKHLDGLPGAEDLVKEVGAIREQRSLLEEPDPAPLVLTRAATLLRAALQGVRAAYENERAAQVADLVASAEWQGIALAERERLLEQHGLCPTPEPKVGTTAELLRELNATPLPNWEERQLALPGRAATAREAAARMLEPKIVSVRPRRATLRTVNEVEQYVKALRAELLAHVTAGTPVII